ncbi:MAG: hypothetical protein K2W96_07675 [Gemmataceae bacterium]|nr:hypothetical protein [Gemmataceae bacterium]
MSALCRGRIVWAELLDPQGRNPELRPAVIVAPTDEIKADAPFACVAITSTAGAAPPEDEIALPWHADPRQSKTGLTSPSVAVGGWRVALEGKDVRSTGGVVPAAAMLRILARLAEIAAGEQASDPSRGG